jgi:L-alanine-DL-glutamate epimerase-like enolase superfamily enzyme
MKITDITFGMLRVPLKTAFKTALRTVEQVEDVIVMVHTDTGHVGYGEAPATAVITGDTHGSIVDAIRHYIAPRLVGQEVANLNRITRLIQGAMEKNTSAKADVITKVDLDGPSLCAFNPVEGGVLFNESEISITDAPGLGIREIKGLVPLPA